MRMALFMDDVLALNEQFPTWINYEGGSTRKLTAKKNYKLLFGFKSVLTLFL